MVLTVVTSFTNIMQEKIILSKEKTYHKIVLLFSHFRIQISSLTQRKFVTRP